MAQPIAPIIIKKKKGGHAAHHGGAWKVAYADFVTAMMALFIVLWLLSSNTETKKAVGGYFQDPTGDGKLIGSTQFGSGEAMLVSRKDMENLKEKLEKAMQMVPEFEKLKDQIQMTVTGEGLRIELLESDKGTFFESGNAQPSAFGKEILTTLGAQVGKLPNRIIIEGHTDSVQFAPDAPYSNWELSADRANAARRFLQTTGLRPDQVLEVRGFADQMLFKANNPKDPANRRISVIIHYTAPAIASESDAKNSKEAKDSKEAKAGKAAITPDGKEASGNHGDDGKIAGSVTAREKPNEPRNAESVKNATKTAN